jgi:single-stranded DNA-binding protein
VFRVAVSNRREQEPSFFTVILWRDQAEHAAESLSKGSRPRTTTRLQQRSWTAEDGSARSVVKVVAEELGAKSAVGNGDDDQGDEEPGSLVACVECVTLGRADDACRLGDGVFDDL